MSEPIEVLIKRLNSIAHGREAAKGFHFFCQVGSAGWPQGVLTLQISGTGWTLLSHRFFEEDNPEEIDQLYSVYLSGRDIRAFIRLLIKHPFWEFDASRWDCEDGETNVHLRLADTGQGFAWGVQLWSRELERQPDAEALMQLINFIIDTVSDGELALDTVLGPEDAD